MLSLNVKKFVSCGFSECFVHVTYTVELLYVMIVGEAHSLKVEKVLFKDKSDFQEVLVFEVLN